MFSEETLEQNKAMEREWQKKCATLYGEKEFNATTYSDIPVKPVYTPADIESMKYDAIALPGEFPYTRGLSPLGYQVEPWAMLTSFGYGGAKESRERWEFLRSIGACGRVGREAEEVTPIRLTTDLPTQRGYDPDEPEARGRVGSCGLSISTIKDMETLFDGVQLDNVSIQFIPYEASLAVLALFVVYAERRGIPTERLFLRANNFLYRGWHADNIGFPPKYALRLMVEQITYCIRHLPRVHHTSVSGYQVAEAGGNAIQEVALSLATAIAVTEECIKVGLNADDVVPGYYGHDWFGLDLLEGVAKIRAKRRLWAKIFSERFGCKKPESLRCKIVPQIGGSMSVAPEPLNNIVRAALMTLGCALAGVDGIFTTSYDEPFSIPTDEAVRIAVRTQQIVYHETNIPNVIDPLGGSYYLEWLTNKIEEEVIQYLQRIEELGGYLKCWESGWIRGDIIRCANDRQQKIDNEEIVIVGQNKYRLPDELQQKVPIFPLHDPRAEQEAIDRVKKFRAERNGERTVASLAKLRETAKALVEEWPDCCGALMPAIIEAYKADATLGEIQHTLQEVLGYVYTW